MRLRTKISSLTIAIALSVAVLILIPVRGVVMDAFRAELGKKAASIAANLSDRIANFILLGDRYQTEKAFYEVLEKESDLEYIFVTDEEGIMFANTFDKGVPAGILSWNPLNERESNIQLLETEKGYIRDVGINIFEGMKAELHLGIREERLKDTLIKMRYLTLPVIGFVILLGVAASILLSRFITRPLSEFTGFAKVLGKGEFGGKLKVRSGDEIGELAQSFNKLSMELKAAMEKMEEAYTYTHLLQTEKLSSIGQISAGLAHELKNPVTTLKMLFQAFVENPDMTREDAAIINKEIEKIDNVLNSFLGFVKEKSFHFTEINIDKLIDRVLSLASFDLDSYGIVVQKDMTAGLPDITGDRALLEQVFLNLVINAVQAMPDGGEIRISGKTDNNFVDVMIWDKGGGIPADLRSKVFNPFFTTKEHGTGLGLSIAYNIINAHRGELFFDTNEGVGTVFTVRLPKAEQSKIVS
ncbi:MAG: signal transduction histidine kinase [Nitrospirae bacterium]|nr:signal transduction histidine kinase [Nitrospirota bacterium]